MDFTSLFLDYTKELESPSSFWRWASYAGIAATMRDSCYYDHGARKTFPNIYVVLLADSAESRKSGPFHPLYQILIHDYVQNTKIVRGRSTIQALIDDLSQDIGIKGKGITIKGGSCILMAEELASFFVQDPSLTATFTDMYDYREEWQYNLRGGKILIKNLCMTMLAATNESFLRDVYTNRAVYGGLLGRTFMVKPDETRPPNSLLDVDLSKYNIKPLAEHLREVKKLNGKFSISKPAKDLYDEWYGALYKSYKLHPDRTGVTQRMHTGVLKLAMILGAARLTLELGLCDIEESIKQVTGLKSNYESYAMGSGKSDVSTAGATILDMMWRKADKRVSREKVMQIHWMDIDNELFEKTISTLEQAGLVQLTANGATHQMEYTMTAKAVEFFSVREMKKNTSERVN